MSILLQAFMLYKLSYVMDTNSDEGYVYISETHFYKVYCKYYYYDVTKSGKELLFGLNIMTLISCKYTVLNRSLHYNPPLAFRKPRETSTKLMQEPWLG